MQLAARSNLASVCGIAGGASNGLVVLEVTSGKVEGCHGMLLLTLCCSEPHQTARRESAKGSRIRPRKVATVRQS